MPRVLRIAKAVLVVAGILVVLLLIVAAALSPFVVFEVRPSENLRIGVGGGTPVEAQAPATLPSASLDGPSGKATQSGGRQVREEEGKGTTAVDAEPDLTPREIGVRVVTEEDEPLEGVQVVLRRMNRQLKGEEELGRGVTDVHGRLVLSVPEDADIELEADGRKHGRAVEFAWVEAGEWNEVELGRGHDVVVTVRTAQGDPAEGWDVKVEGWEAFEGPAPREARTDGAGRATLAAVPIVPGEPLRVWARLAGDPHASVLLRHVPAKRAPQSIELLLPALGAVRIVTAPGWHAERYYLLQQELVEAEVEAMGMMTDERVIDAELPPKQLLFEAERLPVGRYELKVMAEEYLTRRFRFEIREGQRTEVVVPAPGPAVVFSLLDDRGQKVAKHTYVALDGPPREPGGEPVSETLTVVEPGVLRVRGLVPGEWAAEYVWFRSHGPSERSGAIVNFILGPGETTKALQFPKPPPPKPAPKNPHKR